MNPEELKQLQTIINGMGSEAQASLPNTINGIELKGPTRPTSLGDVGSLANKSTFVVDKDIFDKYKKYNIILNPGDTQEELDKERAENQSWLEQLGRSVGRMIWSEAILGSLRGFGDIYDAIKTRNVFKPEYEQLDFTSDYSKFFEDAQNAANERMEIYRKDPNASWALNDFGWWADNAVSVASTLSLLIPAKSITSGIGLIGKSAKYATTASKLAKSGKIAGRTDKFSDIIKGIGRSNTIWDAPLRKAMGANKYAKFSQYTDAAGTALISRIGENYIEARDVYNMVHEDVLNTLKSFNDNQRNEFYKNNPKFVGKTDNEIANYIAGESASKTYRDDFAMLLMDIAQFKAISAAWKNMPNRAVNIGLREANNKAFIKTAVTNNIENAGEKTSKKLGKKIFSAERKAALKDAITDVKVWNTVEALELGEGLEEIYQGIQSEQGREVARKYLDPNYTDRDFVSYISDPEIWEQGFWGVIGGLAFQGAGKGLNKISARLQAAANKDLSEKDIQELLRGDNARRYAEIEGRKTKLDQLITNIKLVQEGKNPFKLKESVGVVQDTNDRFEDIANLEEQQYLVDKLMDNFAEELTFAAIENGNYDLLRQWIDNSNINDYIKQEGGDVDLNVEARLKKDMDSIAEAYNQNYYDILDNADVANPYAAKLATRHITRQQRTVRNLNDDIERKLSLLNLMNDINEFTQSDIEQQIYNQILIDLAEQENKLQGLQLLYESKKPNEDGYLLSKDGYDANIREINAIKKGIVEFLMNNTSFSSNTRAQSIYNEAKELLNSNKESNRAKGASKLLTVLDAFIDEVNTVDVLSKYKKETKDLIIDIAAEQLYKAVRENVIPTSKDEIAQIYEDFESILIGTADSRFNEAYENALNYIRNSSDYDKALSDLLSNNINDRSLLEDMKLLKIGYDNRTILNEAFKQDINKLKNKDNKEVERLNTEERDGEETPPEIQPIDVVLDEENNDDNNPDAKAAKDSGVQEVEEEPTDDLAREVDATAKAMAQEASNISFSDNEKSRQKAASAARDISILRSDLFNKIFDENSDTLDADIQNVLDAIAAQMVNKYNVAQTLANNLAKIGLDIYLNGPIYKQVRKKAGKSIAPVEKFLLRIAELNTSGNWEAGFDLLNGTFDASKIAELSQEEYENRFIELLRTYTELQNGLYTENGKTHVNLYEIAEYVLSLSEQGLLNYAGAIEFITTLRVLAKTYKGNEFVFEGKSFLNSNAENIVQNIYERFTTYESINDYMHFNTTTTEDRTNPTKQKPLIDKFKELVGKNKKLNINYRYKKDTKIPISINLYYTDNNGGQQDIGYLDLVEDISEGKKNTAFRRKKGQGFRFSVSTKNGKISMHKTIDDLFKTVIRGVSNKATKQERDLYNLFKAYFVANNPTDFDRANFPINPNVRLSFIKSDLFKNLLKEGLYGIRKQKIIKGEQVYDFYTLEEFEQLNSSQQELFAGELINKAANIIFYELRSYVPAGETRSPLNEEQLLKSYNNFVEKTFKNYKDTYRLQAELNKLDSDAELEDRSLTIDYVSDNAGELNYNDKTKDIDIGGRTPIVPINDVKNHPYVYVSGGVMYGENGQEYNPPSWMLNGSSGILMYDRQGIPFIAMFTGTNPVVKQGREKPEFNELNTALINYLEKSITDYLNTAGKDAESAYDTIYKTIEGLIGRQRLFSGFEVVKPKLNNKNKRECFSLLYYNEETNKKEPVVTFYKYSSDIYWNGSFWQTNEGARVQKEDLASYAKPNMTLYLNSKGSNVKAFDGTSQESVDTIKRAVSRIVIGRYDRRLGKYIKHGLQFNSYAGVAKANQRKNKNGINNGLLAKTAKIDDYISKKNNKLIIKIGDFTGTYENFAHFLIAHNAMKTTSSGRQSKTAASYTKSPGAIYVDIGTVKAPVKREINELVKKRIAKYVKENAENGKLEMTSEDVLRASGLSEQDIADIKNANEKIKDKFGLLPDKVMIDLNYPAGDDFGGYFYKTDNSPYAGQIVLFNEGIKLLNKNGGYEARRLLIHEQIHKIIDSNDFFKGDVGEQRVDAIIDIWNQFYEYTRNLLKKDKIRQFADDFIKEWGKSTNEKIANEFVSEVLSQQQVMLALNDIDYKGKYKIENTGNISLLQKILNVLSDLIKSFKKLNENTLLDNIYKVLGDDAKITIVTEGSVGKQVKEVSETSDVVEQKDEPQTPVEELNDESEEEVEEESEDVEEDEDEDDEDTPTPKRRKLLDIDDNPFLSSRIENVTMIERHLEDYNEDGVNNPNGVIYSSDMEEFISKFPIEDRPVIVAELTAGRIPYVCQ